jgi:hypothetical protein
MPTLRLLIAAALFFFAIVAAIANENNWTIRSGDPHINGRDIVVSFAGLGPGKTYRDTHARTFVLDSDTGAWRIAEPVPGGVGRLASIAVGMKDRIYVFGGYTVAANGEEASTPWVHAFDPVNGTFEARKPMPVPVDDAVAVSFQERYVYLISGWHDFGNVNLVQRYDTQNDFWVQATPIPGSAVFGHAGGIVGNTIVYCDGVAVRPNVDRRRDAGIIDSENSRRIDWRKIPPHPGKPRYRMAAAGIPYISGFVFIGGSDNPYNYNGIGYNEIPSSPSSEALFYDLETGQWREPANRKLPRRQPWITVD